MKKFYTSISLQVAEMNSYDYEAIGNEKLKYSKKTAFPIVPVINGYVEPGEDFEVISYYTDNEACNKNFEYMQKEISELCKEKGFNEPVYRIVKENENPVVMELANQFMELIKYAEDEDELFCDLTYGTKVMSNTLKMAVQYAYEVKDNTVLGCIVYGEVIRPAEDKSTWYGKIYDETALIQLDELVHSLAAKKVKNPDRIIAQLLNM